MDKIIVKTSIDENGNEHSYETLSDEALQEMYDNTVSTYLTLTPFLRPIGFCADRFVFKSRFTLSGI